MSLICDRDAIVAEAYSWIDTPYHDLACLKGVGVDCVHLLIGVARAVGLLSPTWRCPHYTPGWHFHQQSNILAETLQGLGCQRQEFPQPQHSDIVTFRLRPEQSPSHAGIVVLRQGRPYLIHAVYDYAVLYHRLAGKWQRCLAEVYSFPGIAA